MTLALNAHYLIGFGIIATVGEQPGTSNDVTILLSLTLLVLAVTAMFTIQMEANKVRTKIILTRKPYSNHVTIKYQDGSSDYLPHQQAVFRLRALGVRDPEKVLTHVWNFYRCEIQLTTNPTPQ